jgi:hypothetical protein
VDELCVDEDRALRGEVLGAGELEQGVRRGEPRGEDADRPVLEQRHRLRDVVDLRPRAEEAAPAGRERDAADEESRE